MSSVSPTQRDLIVERAQSRCEYCHVPTIGQAATFPIDHIIPRTLGGTSELDNLALACFFCNAMKWKHIDGLDPVSGDAVRLFHPRTDLWSDHFRWEPTATLIGMTAIGRATIERLNINDTRRVLTRLILHDVGIMSPEFDWRSSDNDLAE